MKYSEIKDLTTQELLEKVKEVRGTLTRMKINHAISPLENPLQIKQIRRDVAKLNTEIVRRNKENKGE